MTYDGQDNYKAAYAYGLERIEVQAVDDTRPEAQDPLYYLYDGLGSVTQLVRPNGEVRDRYRYDEFGVPAPGAKLSEDGRIVNHNAFGYTGELWDEEDDLLYLRSRYYKPETGRFLGRDIYSGILNNPLSMHKYAYVENNPVNFLDPNGLAPVILRYLVQKNGGTITYNPDTGIATVKIGHTTKDYTGQIINGRMIVDSDQFASDFSIKDKCKVQHASGDLFDSVDDTAVAFGLTYNDDSIRDNKEYGASIYIEKKDKKTYYTFTEPNVGDNDSVSIPGAPWFHTRVATIHAHAAYDSKYDNDNFSETDKENAKDRGILNYVVTPGWIPKKI